MKTISRSGGGFKIYTGKPGRPKFVGPNGYGVAKNRKGLDKRTARWLQGPPSLPGDAHWRPCRNNPSILYSRPTLEWQTVKCEDCGQVKSSTLRCWTKFRNRAGYVWRKPPTHARKINGVWRTWVERDQGWTRAIRVPAKPLCLCSCGRKDGKLSKRMIEATINQEAIKLLERQELAQRQPYLDTTQHTSLNGLAAGFSGDGHKGRQGGGHFSIGGFDDTFEGKDGRYGIGRNGL